MKITIGGLPGSGTTTVSRILSEKLNLEWISAGKIFRELAKERERGRKAKSELQEVEVLLKNAEKRVLTLENELKRLK